MMSFFRRVATRKLGKTGDGLPVLFWGCGRKLEYLDKNPQHPETKHAERAQAFPALRQQC